MTTRQETLIPLVVFADRATCDAPARHEHTLYTDGLRGYALSLDESTDCDGLSRLGPIVSADCTDEHCGAVVEWDLTVTGWTGEVEARRIVRDHGEEMNLL